MITLGSIYAKNTDRIPNRDQWKRSSRALFIAIYLSETLVHDISAKVSRKEYIYIYLVIDFSALERTVSFSPCCTECAHSHLGIHSLQHPVLLIDPTSQR